MNTIKLNNLTKATTVSFVVFAYLLIITALSLYVLNTTTTHADTSATASVTVPSACTLTSTITSGNAHSTTMVAGTFEEDIGTTNLKAICNDPDGLDIYAVGYSSNTLGNTNLVGDNGLNIATGLNTSSSTGNGNSNWAMKLFFPASTDPNANTSYQPNILSDTNGSYAEYHVIPATSTKVASFNAVTDTTVGSNLNTTYRIYLEQNQPAGTYIGQVKYTITHPNTSFSLYMQDFTPEMCNTLGTAVEKYLTVYDKRDNTPYRVGYLPDGRCWMMDNLALDLVNVPLASLKGDTNATNTSLEYLKGIRTRNPSTDPNGRYAMSGVSEWVSRSFAQTFSYSDPVISSGGTCVSDSQCANDPTTGEWDKDSVVTYYGAGSGKIGIYYNYCAASAGTYCYGYRTDTSSYASGDTVEDVCPVGWRLPTGNPGSGEYWQLCTATNGSNCPTEPGETVEMGISSPTGMQYQLSTPLSGRLDWTGPANAQGYFGSFWSSTFSNINRRYLMYALEDTIHPQDNANSSDTDSIRCILENRTISDIDYMQEVSPSIIKNTAEGASATLTDTRDNNDYTVKKINGQLWMTQNLRVTGTISSIGSNFTGSDFNVSQYSLDAADASYTDHCDAANSSIYPCSKDSGSRDMGVWYNFAAASAGTIVGSENDAETESDICPSGWHLPSGPSSTVGTNMNVLIGNTTTGWQNPTTGLSLFNAIPGGRYYDGQIIDATYGLWWGNVPASVNGRYFLYYNSTAEQFSGVSNHWRHNGLFVRCVHD